MLLAARVLDWESADIRGSAHRYRDDAAMRSLAESAERGGALDPEKPGSGDAWLGVIRRTLGIDAGMAAAAARVWRKALDERPGAPEDFARCAHAIALLELLRGNVVGAERWFKEARGEVEVAELSLGREWILEAGQVLGVLRDDFKPSETPVHSEGADA